MLVNTKFTVNSRNCDNYGKDVKITKDMVCIN